MKKLFGLLALVLAVVSCQNDFDGANVGGDEVAVTLNVAVPDNATRAAGNDSGIGAIGNIDLKNDYDIRYILEVYDERGALAKERMVNREKESTETSFSLRLVPGRHYSFVVWADFIPQNQVDNGDFHYNTASLANVTLHDDSYQHPMDESRDAYTGVFNTKEEGEGKVFSSATSINITLTRPFAKLRIVTTDMNELYSKLTYATVTYNNTNIYTSFNAIEEEPVKTSTLSNLSKAVNYRGESFVYAGEPTKDGKMTLYADYFFGAEDDRVMFSLKVKDETGLDIPVVNFNTNIPVQRNYLTTVMGPVLTDSNNITVIINDAFENDGHFEDAPYYQVAVSTGFELVKALYEGREIIVLNDITVTAADVEAYLTTRTSNDINPVLNLNGFTVTFVNDTNEPLITVAEGSSLTIVDEKGTGAIVLEGTGAAIENNGTLNIEGGSVESNDNGTVIVNNGEANIEGSTLNEGALENNGEANIADSTLNAGSVENNGTANLNGSEVADDAVENGDDAIVGTYVYTAEELEVAINACVAGLNNEVSFGADIEGDVTVIQKQGVEITINGRGLKYDGSIKVHSNSYHYADAALAIKNVNFETATASVNFVEALEKGSQRYSTNITVKDCKFTATGEAVDTAVGVQIKASKNAKVLNCTATDMHSLIQAQSCDENVEVIGCTINGKNGVAFKQVKAAKVEGTTIVAKEYGIRFDGNIDNYGIVVKNNNVTAYQPLIVRKMTGKNNTIALEGENTLTTEEAYKIVITNGSDDEAYVAPTGTYTLTGADAFVVYPRDVVSSWDEFTAALAANKTFVLLANDITYDKSYTITKDITVDLNGKTFAIDNVSAMLNIGDSKNSSKPNVTIKNGNFNTIIYALSGNVTIQDVVFGGTITYVAASQGVVSTKYANLLMENCKMTNVKKSGATKPRSLCTEGRSSGYLIFRNCNFKNSNLDRPYINPLNGTATLELTNCSLYGGATNIDLGASLVWSNTNLNLNGCSGGFTFTISRASTSLTEDELAVYRAIKQNNSGDKRFIFTDGEKNNL